VDNNIFLVLLSHIFTLGQLIISQYILILSSNLISELMACFKENPRDFSLLQNVKEVCGAQPVSYSKGTGVLPLK